MSAPATSVPSMRDAACRTIADEAAALQRVHDRIGASFDAAAETLVGLDGKVLTLGVGKSGHPAQKTAATLRSVGLAALYLNASDLLHGDLGALEAGDAALLFSKSGSTRELLALVPYLRAREVALIAIVGTPGSALAREADVALDASVEREGCPLDAAPMASALAAQALGDALAAASRSRTSPGFTRPALWVRACASPCTTSCAAEASSRSCSGRRR
jgi:arabinose-5-phosphate isomerase